MGTLSVFVEILCLLLFSSLDEENREPRECSHAQQDRPLNQGVLMPS